MEDLDKELDSLFDDNENGNGNPPNPENGNPKLPVAVKQVITKLRDDRRQLREENERLKADPRLQNQNPPTPPIEPPKPDASVEKLTFAQQNRTLDWEDVENAFAIAQMKGISRQDALKDPLFVAYKEKKEASKKVNDATPPPSNRSSVQLPEGKQMKDLTDAERREMQEKIIRDKRK